MAARTAAAAVQLLRADRVPGKWCSSCRDPVLTFVSPLPRQRAWSGVQHRHLMAQLDDDRCAVICSRKWCCPALRQCCYLADSRGKNGAWHAVGVSGLARALLVSRLVRAWQNLGRISALGSNASLQALSRVGLQILAGARAMVVAELVAEPSVRSQIRDLFFAQMTLSTGGSRHLAAGSSHCTCAPATAWTAAACLWVGRR